MPTWVAAKGNSRIAEDAVRTDACRTRPTLRREVRFFAKSLTFVGGCEAVRITPSFKQPLAEA
jgi:hypothetical protein